MTAEVAPARETPLPLARVRRVWLPLALSWILMGLELPAVAAVIARLPHPEIHLAAYGGVVFPIAMIIEAPIIMLLAASTALTRDWSAYLFLRRWMMTAGAILTVLHLLIAFTPLFDLVVLGVIKPPAEIVEPTRLGLRLMLPWTWSIAFRRFQQGVMIRDGRSHLIGIGTMVRLSTLGLTLAVGALHGGIPGIAVGCAGVALGVTAEAIFAGIAVRPSLVRLRRAPASGTPLSLGVFHSFYAPLALTSLIHLITQPLMSAALSRMPRALDSLAVWPVVGGLSFTLRSVGIAFNEVVVSMIEEPGAPAALRRFSRLLSLCTVSVHLLLVATPLAWIYFRGVSGLSPEYAQLASRAFWLALPYTGLAVMQSWYTGVITSSRATRAIPESVALSLIVTMLGLVVGIRWQGVPGIFIGLGSLALANLTLLAWLRFRSTEIRHALATRI